MDNINKRLCALDKVIAVEFTTSSSVIINREPNNLQRNELGMEVSPKRETDKSSNTTICNMFYVADVLKQMCKAKGLEPTFMEEYKEIEKKLNRDEFLPPEEDRMYAELVSDYSDDYPTFREEKKEEAFALRERQFQILQKAFSDLNAHLQATSQTTDYNYHDTLSYDYYEDHYYYQFDVYNAYDAVADALNRCNAILYGEVIQKNPTEQAKTY